MFRETDFRFGRRFILREEEIAWAELEKEGDRERRRSVVIVLLLIVVFLVVAGIWICFAHRGERVVELGGGSRFICHSQASALAESSDSKTAKRHIRWPSRRRSSS